MYRRTVFLTLSLTVISVLPSQGQTIPKPYCKAPDLNLLTNSTGSVITSKTINPDKLTIPSLWLTKEALGNGILDNWIAYPETKNQPGCIDLIVNQQSWGSLDYLARYAFVNRLGNVAREFRYNLRVFNYQKYPLAAYTCNFDVSPELCKIVMHNQTLSGFERNSSTLLTNP
jgi:hypothetical protein